MSVLKQKIFNLKKYLSKNMLTAFTLVFLIILLGILTWRAFYLHDYISVGGTKNGHIFDYWNMIWTMIAAFSIPTSLFIFYRDKTTEKQKQTKQRLTELIQKDIPEFWALREKNSSEKDVDLNLLQKGISLLLTIDSLDLKNSSEKDHDSVLNSYISLICSEMYNYRDLFIDDFKLDQVISDYMGTNENSKENLNNVSPANTSSDEQLNSSQVLIVRTRRQNPQNEDILGDWLISVNNAAKIKYVIGVSGYVNTNNKSYIDTIKVDKFKVIDGKRIRFKTKGQDKEHFSNEDVLLQLLKNITGDQSSTSNIKTLIEQLITKTGWKGINPTVYLSHLEYLFSQHSLYHNFEDEFLKKITEYNMKKKDNNFADLQIFEKISKDTPAGSFRIRFRSNNLDSVLSDKSNEKNQHRTYNDYSHWYEIISDNRLDTFNFASVFFANKITKNRGDDNQIFGQKHFNEFYAYKKFGNKITLFKPDDENKNGYIITVAKLPKSKVTDEDSLNNFFTSIFNEIEQDVEFVEHNVH